MDEALNQVPPEAWPLIDLMFQLTIIFTALWLIWTVFVNWRRSASNLTSIRGANKNKKAEPDFLSVNDLARKEAIKRGETFDKELAASEREEERARLRQQKKKQGVIGRIGQLLSLLMAVFTIATMISGTIFQVSIMGQYWERFSASERLMTIITEHPIGVAITLLVILYNITRFIFDFKKESA